MAPVPTMLFLHGVGNGDPDGRWLTSLQHSLPLAGYPSPDSRTILAPQYADTLRKSTCYRSPLPEITVPEFGADQPEERLRHHQRFTHRTQQLETFLGPRHRGARRRSLETLVNLALKREAFSQADRYLHDPVTRAAVLNQVLRQVPRRGPLLIVAHSLGSVIAADLIRRLPSGCTVTGIVSVGSPLGNSRFHVRALKPMLSTPPPNLGWWVNFWNPRDPVTGAHGASLMFPWMLDRPVRTGLALEVHRAATYLRQEPVGRAIGFGLYGDRALAVAN